MAESSGEKTEMPTPKKLRDARNKGQVCSSKDIVSTACLIVLFAVVGLCAKMLIDDFASLMSYIAERIGEDPIKTVSGGVKYSVLVILKHSFIYAGVAALIGIVGNVSDKPYVSNSFHCHVSEQISPIEKQDKEGRFWDLMSTF